MFKDLAKLGSQTPGRKAGCFREQLLERLSLQCCYAEFRKYFLLPNSLFERTHRHIWLSLVRSGFDDGRDFVMAGHNWLQTFYNDG